MFFLLISNGTDTSIETKMITVEAWNSGISGAADWLGEAAGLGEGVFMGEVAVGVGVGSGGMLSDIFFASPSLICTVKLAVLSPVFTSNW